MQLEGTSFLYLRDRFTPRAKSLFFARLGFDLLAPLMMTIPVFAATAGVQQPFAAYWYALLLASHVAAYL